MSGEVVMDGLEELEAALKKASVSAQKSIANALTTTGIELRSDVVKRIQRGPASGTIYELSSPKRTHQASSADEAPATDTGRLANSITMKSLGPLTVTVGSKIVYAAALEFGHDYGDGRVIAPRPAWVPAIEKMRPKYIRRLEQALGEAFR